MAEKRISFSGQDTGVSQMMNKLRQESKLMGNELITDSRKYSQVSKEQLLFLEEQIRALEKRNTLEKESLQFKAKQTFQSDSEKLGKELIKIESESSVQEMQVKLLREIVESIKITSKEEIAEDRKRVEQNIRLYQKDPSRFSAEDQLKIAYQRDILFPENEKRRGAMGDVFAGTFLANALQNALSKFSMISAARDEEQAVQGILSSLPIVGELFGSTYGRAREEQFAYGTSRGRFRALSGRNINTLGRFSEYGYSGSEAIDMFSGALTASAGTADINQYLGATRGFGIEQNTLNSLLRVGRFTGSINIENILNKMLGVLEEQGVGRELTNENLQNLVQFTSQMQAINPSFNISDATRVFAELGAIGGVMNPNNPQFANYINRFNQSLSNPQNDFMQARNISLLRRLYPSASSFELLAMMEGGLGTEGFGQAAIEDALKFGAGTDASRFALEMTTGLSKSTILDMESSGDLDAYASGKMSFDDINAKYNLRKEGAAATPKLAKSAAEITDEFASNLGAVNGSLSVLDKTIKEVQTSFRELLGLEVKTGSGLLADLLFKMQLERSLKQPQ